MKRLINVRGATAVGKTTAMKQFCDRRGFSVSKIQTPFRELPICLIKNASIIVLGDYSVNGNCAGADRFPAGQGDIIDCVIAVAETYSPEIIIYEHMLTSHVFRGTNNIASVAREFGYEYLGVQLYLPEEERYRRLLLRSGENAGSKNFNHNNGDRVDAATDKLVNAGYDVIRIDASAVKRENMWKIVEYGIRKALK